MVGAEGGVSVPPVLEVRDLSVGFQAGRGAGRGLVRATEGVGFCVGRGETLAVVGESGSGKSVTSLAVMGLLPTPPARVLSGEIVLHGRDGRAMRLLELGAEARRRVRGGQVAMIFQEPMTSLNPVFTVGAQIAEAIGLHAPGPGAWDRAVAAMEQVGIPDPGTRARSYPHEMSGGMRQRVMIAMALACDPHLLIADEPTTALDVTIQAQILDLLRRLQAERGLSILFITHDLGVVAEMARRVVVMYAGQVVEQGPVAEVLERPLHPYTQGLLNSMPELGSSWRGRRTLSPIPGAPPDPARPPPGCRFAPRCAHVRDECRTAVPALAAAMAGREVRCVRWAALTPMERAA